MSQRVAPRRRKAAFTLIEVLLVLVILVILMSLGVGAYTNAQRNAQANAARSQVGLFETPLRMYFQDLNTFPSSLDSLRQPMVVVNPQKWKGPYFEKDLPLDPWDNPYRYQAPGQHNPTSFDVWSAGPDGVDGTDDDIGNWQ